jgi:hypothetical protein
VDILFGVRLHRYGIDAHAGRNVARHALAAELPASVLADLTGISVSTAERRSSGQSETGPPISASARPMTEEASAAAGNLLIQPTKHANHRYD